MKQKKQVLVWQCMNCHRTYKATDDTEEAGKVAEQKALDCCGSVTQGWYANYDKWGVQKWYGR